MCWRKSDICKSSPAVSLMPQVWEVIGGAEKGGILVRRGADTASEKCGEKLATGALIEEQELVSNRLRYALLSGTGPKEGWVSVEVSGKALVVKSQERYVYTSYGVFFCSQNFRSQIYLKQGSPKAGDKVTEEALKTFRRFGFDIDYCLTLGLMVLPEGTVDNIVLCERDLQEWIDSNPEAPAEPLWPSIDAHHHLQTEEEVLKAGEIMMPCLFNHCGRKLGALTPERLAEDWKGNNIVGSVFIETGWMYDFKNPALPALGETRAVQALADKAVAPMAIVAHIDVSLGRDHVKQAVAKHRQAGKNVVGVRKNMAWCKNACQMSTKVSMQGPQPEVTRLPSFREGVRVLGEEGLTFETWLYHINLPDLIDLAKACPETQIICDHIGQPLGTKLNGSSLEKAWEEWHPDIVALSKCENVSCKLGGLGMPCCGFEFELCEKPPSSDELAKAWEPWFAHCLKHFGPQRCFFESNFQPDKSSGSFTSFWNAFKILAKKLVPGDEAAQRALFYDNAVRTYRLDKPPFSLPTTSAEAAAMSPPLPAY